MVCIHCKSDTRVVNSRHNTSNNSVWRRRACGACGTVFTSREKVDLTGSIVVKTRREQLTPFHRDRLFISIYESCKHRPTAQADATELTETVISKLLRNSQEALVTTNHIIEVTLDALASFDTAAATYYSAYYEKQ